jgi:CubicO group peptidase (beta-lactamase class C family)
MKIFSLLILFLFTSSICPQKNVLSAKLDSVINDMINPSGPGCAVLIIKNGEKIYNKGFGVSNLKTGEKISAETNFYLGSLAKQFTAMAILMLVERGLISEEDLIIKYIPELPEYAKEIKIENLIHHTSGLIDHYSIVGTDTFGLTNKDVLKILSERDSLLFSPGEKYSYSNPNYVLLSLLVEKVSGMSFTEFMEKNIFNPLAMNTTEILDNPEDEIKYKACGYNIDSSSFIKENDYNLFTTGAGGMYSSLEDLYKWDQSLYTEKLVKEETLNKAFTKGRLINDEEIDYGFGWQIDYFLLKDSTKVKRIFHTGSLKGFWSFIMRVPEINFSFIILSNRREIKLREKIFDLYIKYEG